MHIFKFYTQKNEYFIYWEIDVYSFWFVSLAFLKKKVYLLWINLSITKDFVAMSCTSFLYKLLNSRVPLSFLKCKRVLNTATSHLQAWRINGRYRIFFQYHSNLISNPFNICHECWLPFYFGMFFLINALPCFIDIFFSTFWTWFISGSRCSGRTSRMLYLLTNVEIYKFYICTRFIRVTYCYHYNNDSAPRSSAVALA